MLTDFSVYEFAGSSWYASVFLVVNAALGAGLLNFPAAYSKAGGTLTGTAVQVVSFQFVLFKILANFM